MRRRTLILSLSAIGVTVAGCTGQSEQPPSTTTISDPAAGDGIETVRYDCADGTETCDYPDLDYGVSLACNNPDGTDCEYELSVSSFGAADSLVARSTLETAHRVQLTPEQSTATIHAPGIRVYAKAGGERTKLAEHGMMREKYYSRPNAYVSVTETNTTPGYQVTVTLDYLNAEYVTVTTPDRDVRKLNSQGESLTVSSLSAGDELVVVAHKYGDEKTVETHLVGE